LSERLVLIGGALVPDHRLDRIARKAEPFVVKDAKIVLRGGDAVDRRFTEPGGGAGIVLRHAATFSITHGDFVLGGGIAAAGKCQIPIGRRTHILRRCVGGRYDAHETGRRNGRTRLLSEHRMRGNDCPTVFLEGEHEDDSDDCQRGDESPARQLSKVCGW